MRPQEQDSNLIKERTMDFSKHLLKFFDFDETLKVVFYYLPIYHMAMAAKGKWKEQFFQKRPVLSQKYQSSAPTYGTLLRTANKSVKV